MKLKGHSINLGYPVYGARFANDYTLIVAGGGGDGNNGIPNKMTAILVQPENTKKPLKRYRELTLNDNEDSVMSMDYGNGVILAGINENPAMMAKGVNKHLRKFKFQNEHLKFVESIQIHPNASSNIYQKITMVSLDGSIGVIVMSDTPSSVYIIDCSDELREKFKVVADGEVKDITISQDGKLMCYITSSDFEVISLITGRSVFKTKLNFLMSKVRFLDNNEVIIAGCKDNNVYMAKFSIVKSKVIREKTVFKNMKGVTSMNVNINNNLTALATSSYSLLLVRTSDFKVIKILNKVHEFAITKVVFSENGKYLASCSAANTVNVIEIPDNFATSKSMLATVFQYIFSIILIALLSMGAQYLYENGYINAAVGKAYDIYEAYKPQDSSSYFTVESIASFESETMTPIIPESIASNEYPSYVASSTISSKEKYITSISSQSASEPTSETHYTEEIIIDPTTAKEPVPEETPEPTVLEKKTALTDEELSTADISDQKLKTVEPFTTGTKEALTATTTTESVETETTETTAVAETETESPEIEVKETTETTKTTQNIPTEVTQISQGKVAVNEANEAVDLKYLTISGDEIRVSTQDITTTQTFLDNEESFESKDAKETTELSSTIEQIVSIPPVELTASQSSKPQNSITETTKEVIKEVTSVIVSTSVATSTAIETSISFEVLTATKTSTQIDVSTSVDILTSIETSVVLSTQVIVQTIIKEITVEATSTETPQRAIPVESKSLTFEDLTGGSKLQERKVLEELDTAHAESKQTEIISIDTTVEPIEKIAAATVVDSSINSQAPSSSFTSTSNKAEITKDTEELLDNSSVSTIPIESEVASLEMQIESVSQTFEDVVLENEKQEKEVIQELIEDETASIQIEPDMEVFDDPADAIKAEEQKIQDALAAKEEVTIQIEPEIEIFDTPEDANKEQEDKIVEELLAENKEDAQAESESEVPVPSKEVYFGQETVSKESTHELTESSKHPKLDITPITPIMRLQQETPDAKVPLKDEL